MGQWTRDSVNYRFVLILKFDKLWREEAKFCFSCGFDCLSFDDARCRCKLLLDLRREFICTYYTYTYLRMSKAGEWCAVIRKALLFHLVIFSCVYFSCYGNWYGADADNLFGFSFDLFLTDSKTNNSRFKWTPLNANCKYLGISFTTHTHNTLETQLNVIHVF